MNLTIILGEIGPWQIVIILFVLLIFFGGKKIPELMKGLGEGVKEFKKAANNDKAPEKEIEVKKE